MKLAAALAAFVLGACACTAPRAAAPVWGYKVVRTFPHDPTSFTEGLFFRDGYLYESTGLEGRSYVRKLRLETGEVLMQRNLPRQYFGEGVIDWKDRLIQLTWRSQVGFIYSLDGFQPLAQFQYGGEGWALTRNDHEIFMSDGTAELRVLDPETLREKRRIRVIDGARAVDNLNELEWVKGEVWANVWQTDLIARIDPKTGKIVGWVDLAGLLGEDLARRYRVDVLNGIAYDAAKDRLVVTGKFWPNLYEIRLTPPAARRR